MKQQQDRCILCYKKQIPLEGKYICVIKMCEKIISWFQIK